MKHRGQQPQHENILPLVLRRAADRLDRQPRDRHAHVDEPLIVQIRLHVIGIVQQHAALAQRFDMIAVGVIVKRHQKIRLIARGEHFARAHAHLENRRPARDRRGDRHVRHHLLLAPTGQPREQRAGTLDAILRIAGQPDYGVADALRAKLGTCGRRKIVRLRVFHRRESIAHGEGEGCRAFRDVEGNVKGGRCPRRVRAAPRGRLHSDGRRFYAIFRTMNTLAEIEAAAELLPSEEKEQLLRFLAMRLRQDRALPQPRLYSDEELVTMLAEDEADGERFRQGR